MSQALTVSQLTKRYDNGFEALKGIDLSVEQGDFYALLGPNGAGKSTTLGIICGLVQPTSGHATVMGYDVQAKRYLAKQQLGVVPQEFNFNQFEKPIDILTAQAGYFGLKGREVADRAQSLLKALDLWDKRNEVSRMLSGGMKRRLMIARALIHNPDVLILDEPTAGVDIELRRSMWAFMRELNEQGTTIVLTTHYLEEAEQMCRNIGIIDQGRIVQSSTMSALLSKLKTQRFVLDVNTSLSGIDFDNSFSMTLTSPSTLEVTVAEQQSLNELFALLSTHGIHVTSMRNKNNRLEQLFVDLINEGRA